MALRLRNGVSNYITHAAATSINNLATGFIILWVQLSAIPGSGQRNLFGKSSGADRFISAVSPTALRLEYGGLLTNCVGAAVFASIPFFKVLAPICIAFEWSFTVSAPKIYVGDLNQPLTEASSYSTITVGSGLHDDSASNLIIGTSGDLSTANAWPGEFYSVLFVNRLSYGLNELRDLQFSRSSLYTGTIISTEPGKNGSPWVIDKSGSGNNGIITGAFPCSDIFPVTNPRKIKFGHSSRLPSML